MKMSQGGIDALLKPFEGCKLTAYRCPANICTIGYGHTSAAGAPVVTDGMIISQQQSEDILRRDLVKYETYVNDMVQHPMNQHQFDVLVDFVYNEGPKNLKTSTMLKKINAGQLEAVPAELMKFTKGGGKTLPGLVRRRQAEGAWWMAGTPAVVSALNAEPTADEHEQRVTADPVDAPTMANSKQGNVALLTAGVGGLGAVKEVAAQAQDASDTLHQVMGLFTDTTFTLMVGVIGLAVAIWYFRKQHMEEHGV